tara:strand:- start:1972 stop:2256 length:285 start_codon:yes stop_codon:yes gene_type:complete
MFKTFQTLKTISKKELKNRRPQKRREREIERRTKTRQELTKKAMASNLAENLIQVEWLILIPNILEMVLELERIQATCPTDKAQKPKRKRVTMT